MYVRFDHKGLGIVATLLAFSMLACQSVAPKTGDGSAVAFESGQGAGTSRARQGVSEPQVKLSSDVVSDGSVVLVTVTLDRRQYSEEELVGKFGNVVFPFYQIGENEFEALLGIPYAHKPGDTEVIVTLSASAERKEQSVTLPLRIVAGDYASETLRVSPRHTNPSPKDLARIRRDSKEVGEIYRQLTRKKYWDGEFRLPIESAFTSVYGTRRVFNGELTSYHSGLDLRAAVGTPIFSPARGIVVLAKDLFFTGKTVMLDHGYGVITLYAHLDKIHVKPGDLVETGKQLGLSGVTGRVSGPHLHWSAVIHGVKVNPLDFMKVVR